MRGGRGRRQLRVADLIHHHHGILLARGIEVGDDATADRLRRQLVEGTELAEPDQHDARKLGAGRRQNGQHILGPALEPARPDGAPDGPFQLLVERRGAGGELQILQHPDHDGTGGRQLRLRECDLHLW